MATISAVNLLVDSFLPEDLRDPMRIYDKKGTDSLLTEVARRYPDQYPAIAKQLGDIGRNQAYRRGETFRLADFKPVFDRAPAYADLDKQESRILRETKDPDERRAKLADLYSQTSDHISKQTNAAALARRNNIALTVLTGARGKEAQLRDMISTPGFYSDGKGGVVPWFVRNSFAEGIRPSDLMAGTYAARGAVTESKTATAKGGFLAKTLSRAAATHVITQLDCGTSNGIDLPLDESDLRGRVLQREVGGYAAGTVIDRKVLAGLKNQDVPDVIVRSPLTCNSEHGLCSKCFGVKAEGRFPKIGEHVGVTASNALGEPLCLAADTLVRMADWSVKKIQDIKVGDTVLGSDMQGRLTPTRVLNVFHNGPRECVKTVVRKGRGARSELIELVSTSAHKVLSYQCAWGKMVGSAPAIQPIETRLKHHRVYLGKGLITDYGRDEPMADLVGLLIGDGCYNGGITNAGIGFSCYDPELEAYSEARLREYGMRLSKGNEGEFRVSMVKQGDLRRGVKSTGEIWHPLKKWLIKEGMWGQTSTFKTLPKNIEEWNNRSVAALIGGLIATDGWVCLSGKDGGVTVGFSSNSKCLLEGIKSLLEMRFGIYGTSLCAKFKKRPGGGSYDPTYELCICGSPDVVELQRVIPVPGCKKERLKKMANARTVSCLERGRYRVISQAPIGVIDTWDIEVDNETHLFLLANQMIVSNTQSALSQKHVTSGKGKSKEFSGLDYIQQFMDSPEEFRDKATTASIAGKVESVIPAAQGGSYVIIGGERHYVPVDREITVEPGEVVEAGDSLTDGLVDVEDVLKHKGLGAARHYWVDGVSKMAKASGAAMDRRLFEVLARANVDHVDLDDPVEDGFLPDDRTRYSQYVNRRTLPEKIMAVRPHEAVGKWLEQPALHHTIGTRVTPKMAEHLGKQGFEKVHVSEKEPGFRPVFVRLQSVAATDDDWLASLGGSYLGNQLQQGITRAQDTNIESNHHPVPRLAVGVGYGDNIETTGKF